MLQEIFTPTTGSMKAKNLYTNMVSVKVSGFTNIIIYLIIEIQAFVLEDFFGGEGFAL